MQYRIKREMDFKQEIISQINSIISELAFCDPTNATSTLDLSQEKLRDVVAKLNESEKKSNSLKTENLRDPELASPARNISAGPPKKSLPVGRRPPPAEPTKPAPPKVPGPTLREMGINLFNRSKSAVRRFQNTNPPTSQDGIPQNSRVIGGRRTRRKGKSKRIV